MSRALIVLCLALAGCQQLYWVKLDGTWIADKPALLQQLQVDKTICQGRVAGAALGAPTPNNQPYITSGPGSGWARTAASFEDTADLANQVALQETMMDGCMAEKGYKRAPAPTAPR